MNTDNIKGAVEFCNDLKEVEFKYSGIEYDLTPHLDNIIALLKRGEKYEKMWEEDAKDWLGNDLDLEEWMNDTKQKYFPKTKVIQE